jgi:hypothetical protein
MAILVHVPRQRYEGGNGVEYSRYDPTYDSHRIRAKMDIAYCICIFLVESSFVDYP